MSDYTGARLMPHREDFNPESNSIVSLLAIISGIAGLVGIAALIYFLARTLFFLSILFGWHS